MPRKYDLFLCYNIPDKNIAQLIQEELRRRGVRCAELQQHPGRLWYSESESALRRSKAVVVFFGTNGHSPWEKLEMRLLLTSAALEGIPIIPVLLPGTPNGLTLPRFLAEFIRVDLREGLTEEALDSLTRCIPRRAKAREREHHRNADSPPGMGSVHCILFLGANPEGEEHLRLDHEVREIDLALRRAEFRANFDLRQQLAVRPADLQDSLLRYHPRIVHFSGHGKTDGVVLEDETGHAHKVPAIVLARIFRELKDEIRCVVLNACYSEDQAHAIAEDIDCVIGMSSAIDDSAAIQFSTAFYQALAFGKSVAKAFNLACAQIDLAGLGEGHLPRLIARLKDPNEIIFAGPKSLPG